MQSHHRDQALLVGGHRFGPSIRFLRVVGQSPSIFPSRLTGCPLPRGRDQVDDRDRVGQPLVGRNLVEGAQVGVSLR
jgi:hypothetical protein